MAEPLLHRAQIHARPQASCCERRPELMQPQVLFIELCPLRTRFQAIQKIQLRIAPRCWEHEIADLVGLSLPRLQFFRQLCWNGNLTLLVCLWSPVSIRFMADSNSGSCEVQIRPVRVHHFLLSHSRHQEELVPEPFFVAAGFEE